MATALLAGRQRRLQGRRRRAPGDAHRPSRPRCAPARDRALLALQGPQAVDALARMNPSVAGLMFMTGGEFTLEAPSRRRGSIASSRAAATPARTASRFRCTRPQAERSGARAARPARGQARPGSGARNSLRLEAGLCLYGNDIDTDHHAGRSGARPGRSRRCAAPAARAPAAFPARPTMLAPARRHGTSSASVSAWSRWSASPVREHTELRDAARPPPRRSHQRPARPDRRQADGHGLRAGQPCAAGNTRSTPSCAASPCRWR